MTLRACYVVNAVGETSVPADIAASLVEFTDVEVDVLAWFNVEPFDRDDVLNVQCLNAPNSKTGINHETYARAKEILREYDLIQAHHNHSGSFAKVIARRFGVPCVSREGNMRKGFNRLGRVANGLTNPFADRVVCNSRAVYDSFTRWEDAVLPKSKVTIIPNGVDFDRLEAGRSLDWSPRDAAGVSDESIVVATAGLLTEQKNHETLLRALAAARERTDREIELFIAGNGPRRRSLEKLTSQLGIEDSVHFLGYLERLQVYKMLSETDVYAMPSRWEGFSAAAVEALASGNAAVFSDIPPFMEPYEDLARFHPVEDHESLAGHLVELVEDREERNRLASLARDHVEQKYAMKSVAQQYSDLYEEILRAR